jgi:hypothetical protein
VTSGTSQVDETTLSEEDDVSARWHEESVDLRLDVLHAFGVLLQPRNIDLDIEVANV